MRERVALVVRALLPSGAHARLAIEAKEDKKQWVNPAIAVLKQLKNAGLTTVGLPWTFFERRVQPLKARARPMFQYTGPVDPTRELEAELMLVEVKARVKLVLKKSRSVEVNLNVRAASPANQPPPRAANWAEGERQQA
ncbi:hypothetical protein BAE44_0020683 [Dichanthelium oligosanthes]|uniref:Uncharacterized protein n=1 Tax=Dichanthelium oligosanthes TaxID=888268 RepID=A0A1E5UZN7_9POAL|nr:hypothetical protein BAE44_0020683 [Dichanthelium oligosanthes]